MLQFYADDAVIYCLSPSDVQTLEFLLSDLLLSSLTLPNLNWFFNAEKSKDSFPSYHLLCDSIHDQLIKVPSTWSTHKST